MPLNSYELAPLSLVSVNHLFLRNNNFFFFKDQIGLVNCAMQVLPYCTFIADIYFVNSYRIFTAIVYIVYRDITTCNMDMPSSVCKSSLQSLLCHNSRYDTADLTSVSLGKSKLFQNRSFDPCGKSLINCNLLPWDNRIRRLQSIKMAAYIFGRECY